MATHALECAAVLLQQDLGFTNGANQDVQKFFTDCHAIQILSINKNLRSL